jgi:hypothetical protein
MLQTDKKESVANTKGYYSAIVFYVFARFFRILYVCSNIWNILVDSHIFATFSKKKKKETC